ncbi:MAG: tetratricopeptide repeat protein [Syntrophales bacterium]|nr:tetratricopeptide repeat protein [Syntrophales bacterium]MDD5641560.1 tetratricopeptide repeat protein [Syntrophales bacterium]
MAGIWGSLLACCLLAWGCAAPKPGVGLLTEAVAVNDAGYQDYRQGKWNLAEEKFSQALTMNRLIDRQEGIAANLNNLGVIALKLGDFKQAGEYFAEALSILKPQGDPAGLCETLNNLGALYQAQGKLNDAEKSYQEAMVYARQAPPGPLVALTLTHLGDVARVRGDLAGALNLYEQALRLDLARKDRQGQAVRRERLGRTYLALQNYSTAGIYLLEALREFRRLEDTNGIVDTLDSLTRLSLALGNREMARDYGERALKIYEARRQEREAKKLQKLLGIEKGKEDKGR